MALDADDLAARIAAALRGKFRPLRRIGRGRFDLARGESVLELQGGFRDARRETPWTDDTLVLFWSATKGSRQRLSSCTVCRNAASRWSGGWRNSGRSLRKTGRRRSHSRNCFPIRPAWSRSMKRSKSPITRRSSGRWRNRDRSGRRAQRTAITRAPLVF